LIGFPVFNLIGNSFGIGIAQNRWRKGFSYLTALPFVPEDSLRLREGRVLPGLRVSEKEAAMTRKVKLILSEGNDRPKEFEFQNPARSVVGRADDCDIRFPMDPVHMDISRHHCLFEIDPPTVKVRDLGSRNGTYVNGEKIGERSAHDLPPDGWDEQPPKELREGDEVRVGHSVIRVEKVEG
jgi:eukaryotic-like serine/threonine-protein kinase